jgi:hypothetical protein
MSNTKNIVGYLLRVVTRATNNIFMDEKRYGWLMVRRSARGGQVTPEAHKFRQRRTGYVPTQSGRTRFRPRRSHRLVLSANIGMILRTQTPAHTDSFGQQRQKFYLVVGQPPNNGIEYHKTGCNW